MVNERQTSVYFDQVILLIATFENRDKEFLFDNLLTDLGVPRDFRDILLHRLWNVNHYIDARPALKNPPIQINEKGIAYAETLDENLHDRNKDYNEESKAKIITLIKDHIEKNDTVRVGWAIGEVLKIPVKEHLIQKVTAAIMRDNRYAKDRPISNPKDWNIFKDPAYKEPKWEDTHPFWDRVRTGGITAIFTLIVGITVYHLTTRKNILKQNQQDRRIEILNEQVSGLQKSIDTLR